LTTSWVRDMSVTKRSAAVVVNLRSIRFPRTPGPESRRSGFVSGERDEFGFVLGFVGFVFWVRSKSTSFSFNNMVASNLIF
jgi:hypothetical protein